MKQIRINNFLGNAMSLFRVGYSVAVVILFYVFRTELGLTTYQSIAFGMGVILCISMIDLLFSEVKSFRFASSLIFGIIFLLLGFLIITLLGTFFTNNALKLSFIFLFIYIGVYIGYKSHKLLEYIFNSLTPSAKIKHGASQKILDTSTLIDGRVVDVVMTGFIEGALVIPSFVLRELQNIADSHEHMRRQKGRRGLGVLKRLQEQKLLAVEIYSGLESGSTVDEKLIELAKRIGGTIITTDFNLLKVAEIQDVKVLNINSLALAIRQTILPGEEFNITIVKEGKEMNQGIGYLDDGTMVVVEQGRKLIGENRNVEVSSLLQTESGRIIFTILK